MAAGVIEIGDGLSLQEAVPSLAEKLFSVVDANRDHLRRRMPFVDTTRSVEDTMDFCRHSAEGRELGTTYNYAICERSKIIGCCGIMGVQRHFRQAEIGYWLAADAQGRGVMTRAVAGLLDLGFDELGLHRIQVRIAPDNARSLRIPERLGFRYEGLMRDAAWVGNRPYDCRLYAILAPEWRATRLTQPG